MNILITGATKGIGQAIAARLAPEADALFLVARGADLLEEAAGDLQSGTPGLQVHACATDLGDPQAAQRITTAARKAGFAPDVLILNAGVFVAGPLADMPAARLRAALDVNVIINHELVQAFLPALRRSDRPRIILVGSTAGREAYATGPVYSVSKWALRGYVVNLRAELMEEGIGVTHVVPGNVYTANWEGIDISPDRIVRSTDIAEVVHTTLNLSPQALVEEVVVRPVLGDVG